MHVWGPPKPQPACVLVWSADRRAVEALVAQWPGSHEFITPDEPGDRWGARLSLSAAGVGAEPVEYEIAQGRLVTLPTLDAFMSAVLH